MENFLQKLYLKWIRFYTNTLILGKNYHKVKMYSLMGKNYHYGFLIETIIVKLKLMEESWPKYNNNEEELALLNKLIQLGEELLEILEKEEECSHLRSKEYLDKQKQFYILLNSFSIKFFY